MNDIYPPQTLPELLADLCAIARRHIASGQKMNLDSMAGLHAKLRDAHRMSLAGHKLDAVGYALTGQIGSRADGHIGPRMGEVVCLREALASEQRLLQAKLDAGQELFIDLTRPESAGVVSFPGMTYQANRSPDGGDAA